MPNFTILDHIDNIRVEGNVFECPSNEYYALVCLWEGMEFLYNQAKRCDVIVQNRLDPNMVYHLYGNAQEFNGINMRLLSTSFQWYSVSACQYVRLVGAINHKQDNTRQEAQQYTKDIIPEVIAFRDKIGSKFAWSTKNKQDNPAERAFSVMPQLSFIDDSFYTSSMTLTIGDSKTSSDSSALEPWSISRIHEKLRQRYWPKTD